MKLGNALAKLLLPPFVFLVKLTGDKLKNSMY